MQKNISGAIDSQQYLTQLNTLAKSVNPDFFQDLLLTEIVDPLVDKLHGILNTGKNLTPALNPLYDLLSSQLDSLVSQIKKGDIDYQSFVTQYIDLTKSLAKNFFKDLATNILNLLPFSSVAIGGAVSDGKFGIGGSVIVDIFNVSTTAYVGNGTQINQGANTQAGINQSFSLKASDHTQIKNIAGGLGITTGAAGIGIGVDVEILNRDVTAYVDSLTTNSTKITAAQGVSIQSSTSEDIFNLTLSGGLAGKVGVGGTVAVNIITNNSVAGAAGTIATDGDVSISATDNSTIQALAGGFAVAAKLTEGSQGFYWCGSRHKYHHQYHQSYY